MAAARSAMLDNHRLGRFDTKESSGGATWHTRGANFVVAVTQTRAGDRFERGEDQDEFILFAPSGACRIETRGERATAPSESVSIVPAGRSLVEATEPGTLVRIFTSRAADLAAMAWNADVYARDPGNVQALQAPSPSARRLRIYALADYRRKDVSCVFRSHALMLNVLNKRETPRDTTTLRPHRHDDFEQASVLVEGRYVHHLRYPWTSDMREWRDDAALDATTPSVVVIPPGVIHTSRSIGAGVSWLVDVFAPPREDFLATSGLVLNAADYALQI